MPRQPKYQSMRNLKSSGWKAAKFTGRTLDKATSGLFRWLTTDHSGMTRMLIMMPEMGFWDSIKYILTCFFIAIAGMVLQIIWLHLIIFIGLSLLFNA